MTKKETKQEEKVKALEIQLFTVLGKLLRKKIPKKDFTNVRRMLVSAPEAFDLLRIIDENLREDKPIPKEFFDRLKQLKCFMVHGNLTCPNQLRLLKDGKKATARPREKG